MKKWIIVLAIVLIAAIIALAVWHPWKTEQDLPLIQNVEEYTFTAIVVEISGDFVLVEP